MILVSEVTQLPAEGKEIERINTMVNLKEA